MLEKRFPAGHVYEPGLAGIIKRIDDSLYVVSLIGDVSSMLNGYVAVGTGEIAEPIKCPIRHNIIFDQ